jgi:hypothetical protein
MIILDDKKRSVYPALVKIDLSSTQETKNMEKELRTINNEIS